MLLRPTAAKRFSLDDIPDVSGLTVQGITFTGTLADLPLFSLVGIAIVVSAPGFGVVFDDCYFVDLDATSIFTLLRTSAIVPPENYPVDSGSVTIKNSYFKNVAYRDGLLLVSGNNQLLVEDCVFENIADTSDNLEGVFFFCRTSDLCTFTSSCLFDVSWNNYLFLQLNYNASLDGTNFTDLEGTRFEFENNFGENYLNSMGSNIEVSNCSEGFGVGNLRLNPPGIKFDSCQAPPGFDAAACPSDARNGQVCLNPFWSKIIPFLFPC